MQQAYLSFFAFVLHDYNAVLYDKGGVYLTPGRLSPRSEFTPVPSHGSTFVYMIPPQNVMPAQVTPVVVPRREFHSGTKSRNGIISTRNDHTFRYEIGLPGSVGGLERVAHA